MNATRLDDDPFNSDQYGMDGARTSAMGNNNQGGAAGAGGSSIEHFPMGQIEHFPMDGPLGPDGPVGGYESPGGRGSMEKIDKIEHFPAPDEALVASALGEGSACIDLNRAFGMAPFEDDEPFSPKNNFNLRGHLKLSAGLGDEHVYEGAHPALEEDGFGMN